MEKPDAAESPYLEEAPAEVTAEQVAAAAQAAKPQAPPPQAQPQPPRPKHPQHLLRHAEALGFHPALVEALPTEQLTQVVMDALAAQRREAASQQLAAQVQRPAEAASAPTLGPPQGQRSLAEEFDWGEYEDDDGSGRKVTKKVDPEDLHPALVGVLKRQQQQLAELRRQLAEQSQQQQQARERTTAQRFDAAFARFPKLFGAGSAEDVKGTPEFARRSAVYAQVMAIPPAQRAGLTIEQAVEQVAKTLFGPLDAGARVEGWNAGAVAVPTKRGADPAPGRSKAIQSVEEYMREQRSQGGSLFAETTEDEFLQ